MQEKVKTGRMFSRMIDQRDEMLTCVVTGLLQIFYIILLKLLANIIN